MGTGRYFFRVKQPQHDTEHSPASSAEVKEGRAIPSLLHDFMA
jgi:hypothetical protein